VSPHASATATIHWLGVPLSDAIGRLEKLFGESVFLDRRIDPTQHVALDIQASSAEQVLTALATARDFSVIRIGQTVYVGPNESARRLRTVARLRTEDAIRLPDSDRAALLRKRAVTWPRLTAPRVLIKSIVERAGWRIENTDRIPHDLWRAGELPGLTLVEQLSVLLVGFDLTFEIQGDSKSMVVVPIPATLPLAEDIKPPADLPPGSEPIPQRNARQVYSLRVVEKPVGPVLRELARRLNWQIEFDEAAIAAAGRSLDERVSMAVENAEPDTLLEALLTPAGLTFERDGERIRILPIASSAPTSP
jgi:hypothetical protein